MDRLLSLKASAGSGKTFSLANRYLSLLFKGAKVNEIVAITFTNKAAKEMEERIVKYLRNLEDEKDFLKELSKNSGLDEKIILNKRSRVLDEFLKSDIHITTIDSFIQKIARKFGYYGGVEVDFDIKEDNLEDIFKEFLNELDEKSFNSLVEFQKRENLINFFENLYLKDKEINKSQVISCQVSSSNLEIRIEKLKEEILDLVDRCSDSAKKFISQDIEKIFFSGRLKTILENGSIKYNRSIFNKCYSEILEAKFFEYVELIKEYLYNKYLQKEYFILNTIFDFYTLYKNKKWEVKKKENYLDFKDVEHLVYKILVEDKLNKDFLYFRLDSKINHILIDEFQDTSITQWKIISPLVDEIKSGEGQSEFKSFFYVGDVKQAIYRFRGGNSELFDYVYKSLKEFGMTQKSLNTNYRSGKVIVEFVNEVFNLEENANKDGGYVEIRENRVDDENSSKNYKKYNWRENLEDVLEFLFSNKVKDKDIAILVYGNDDILEVADFIKTKFNKQAVTSTTKNIINQASAKAVVDLMKYLYYKEKGRLFLFNFLTFINEEFRDDFKIDIKEDKPSIMIKQILDNFNLWDEATLKLLEYSMRYESLIDFVFDIDNCDEKLSSDIEGINVLTIHKSKGLEFENVIVIDRMKKKNNKGIKLLYDYEGIELKKIRYFQKNMEELDEEYKKVLEKEKEAEIKDLENVEYVAFTRPKKALFILKNEDESNFIKLSKYKGDLKRGEFIVESKEEEIKENKKFDLELNFYGKQNVKKEKEYKPNDYEAIYKGLAIHSLFEIEDRDFILNRYGNFVKIDEIEELVKKAKDFEEYKNRLNGKIYKELPFVYEKKEGRIDLMIENDDEIIIIDYKTTKPSDERVYFEQVNFYKKVMREIKNKNTKGFIFYIEEMELKEVK